MVIFPNSLFSGAPSQPAKFQKKAVQRSEFFTIMALRIECRFNKNSLLRCCFLAISQAAGFELLLVFDSTFFYKEHLYKDLEAEKGSKNKEFLRN